MARGSYRAHDGRLAFQGVGQNSFAISRNGSPFRSGGAVVAQTVKLLNDVTIVGELEPQTYVRDYFLGDGITSGLLFIADPFWQHCGKRRPTMRTRSLRRRRSSTASADPDGKLFTVFADDYAEAQLPPTMWNVADPNNKVSLAGGQLQINGGPVTIAFVEQIELAGGWLMQHGNSCSAPRPRER